LLALAPFALPAQQSAFVPAFVMLAFDISQFAFSAAVQFALSAAVQLAAFFASFIAHSFPDAFETVPLSLTGTMVGSLSVFEAVLNEAFVPCAQHDALDPAGHFLPSSPRPKAREREKRTATQQATITR
jgi:hypothetical protein